MNNDTARLILTSRRPDGSDDGDPVIQDALAQAARDPALQAWFARESRFDLAAAGALGELQPPPTLRAQILACMAAQRRVRSRSRRHALFALAACLALCLGLFWFRPWQAGNAEAGEWLAVSEQTPRSVDQLLARALAESLDMAPDMGLARRGSALRKWLADPATLLASGVPFSDDELRAQGCRTLTIGGREVLQVCLKREGKLFHLYIAHSNDFPVAASGRPEPAQLATRSAIASAWREGSRIYALSVATDEAPSEDVFSGLI